MKSARSAKIDIIAVAKAARVSPSTVSRSFNHPELLKPSTRKRIERAVERLGYIRNRAAQAMHGRRSATIGLIVPTIDHAIFAEVVQSFSEEVDAAGFTILMASHGYDLRREYAVLRKMLEHRVDGVALIGLEHEEATYLLLEQQKIPSLAIWNYDAASRISCVGAENRRAGALAAEHLLALGHRRIGVVFPDIGGNDRARDRFEGAMATLAASGIELRDEWQVTAPYSVGMAKAMCLELMANPDRPGAMLCGNDVIAQGAIFAAQKLGLRVPHDVSVMGIGDFKGSSEMEPPLSSIRLPARRIGRIAGQQIAHAIAAEEMTVQRQSCQARLVARGTTMSVPGG